MAQQDQNWSQSKKKAIKIHVDFDFSDLHHDSTYEKDIPNVKTEMKIYEDVTDTGEMGSSLVRTRLRSMNGEGIDVESLKDKVDVVLLGIGGQLKRKVSRKHPYGAQLSGTQPDVTQKQIQASEKQ